MASIASIASIGSLSAPAASTATSRSSTSPQSLDFMKLLMAQMQNQNPLDPQSGTEFMGQMAQFSQLDGINKLNQNFSQMLLTQNLTQGANLIGKTVTYVDGTGNTARGTVGSLNVNAGAVQLMVGGVSVGLSQVQSVSTGPKAA